MNRNFLPVVVGPFSRVKSVQVEVEGEWGGEPMRAQNVTFSAKVEAASANTCRYRQSRRQCGMIVAAIAYLQQNANVFG